jgi:hypothetical protein
LARSVPLSRFTSRVGGGSAFYVRLRRHTFMFTDSQMKTLFLRVMDKMLEARWLESHVFTDGKGHHLVWTPAGAERSVLLKKIAETYRLTSDDRAAYGFDILAHGESLPGFVRPIPLDDTLATYWRESVGQLGLHRDEDGLMGLVHIVIGWAPDSQPRVKFGGSQ